MYLENSQNFEVTGNIFTSTGTPAPCNCNSFGVIVRNVGNLTQEIYRNDFTGFYIGIQAIGQNRDYNNYAGLQIRCNRFYNTHYHDISVVKDPNLHSIINKELSNSKGQHIIITAIQVLQAIFSPPINGTTTTQSLSATFIIISPRIPTLPLPIIQHQKSLYIKRITIINMMYRVR